MAWINFFADLRALTIELRRCADALERAHPIPTEGDATEPVVSYYDEKRAALEDYIEHLRKTGQLPLDAELPEEDNVPSEGN